jgi:hypothetical protein
MVFFGDCEVDFDPHPELRLLCSVKEMGITNDRPMSLYLVVQVSVEFGGRDSFLL